MLGLFTLFGCFEFRVLDNGIGFRAWFRVSDMRGFSGLVSFY